MAGFGAVMTTIREFAQIIPALRDEARHIWGEGTKAEKVPHDLPVEHGDYKGLPSKHTSKELDDWININHRCKKCQKVIRTWNERKKACYYVGKNNLGWKYHVKEMVISDDPVAYLEQHMPKKEGL